MDLRFGRFRPGVQEVEVTTAMRLGNVRKKKSAKAARVSRSRRLPTLAPFRDLRIADWRESHYSHQQIQLLLTSLELYAPIRRF